MPSLDFYRKNNTNGVTVGQMHKRNSDMIMNSTWWNDIGARRAYFYDMYHDSDPRKLCDLHPEDDKNKIPIDIKYIQSSSQTYEKDSVTFHLQFRPGQECVIPYYQQYIDMYEIEWPLSLYVDIEDEEGSWNRWLIVAKANGDALQFPTYEILRCDYTFQYIINNVKQEIAGVLRSQNS